jgi:hypothetical protein
MLNMQLQTAKLLQLGFDNWSKVPDSKKSAQYKISHRSLGFEEFFGM